MTTNAVGIESVTIESDDPTTTEVFVEKAFGLAEVVRVGASHEPTSGFRGYSISLVFEQPDDVDLALASAIDAGAAVIKPVQKSFWGYGGSLRSPDGTVWTLASSSKKNIGEATGRVDQIVLLAGVTDVRVTKDFYAEQGLPVKRSFGAKYVEFDSGSRITFAIQSRRAVAKNAGVDAEGSGSRRLVVAGGLGAIVDPDGFVWV